MLPRRRTCCRCLVWWCLFPLLVLAVTLSSLARLDVLYDEDQDDGGFQWSGAQESLQACTYEQLQEAFGESARERPHPFAPENVSDDNEKCWRSSDRILRISQDAILNFHSLIPLGHGNKGGVYMVFLNLSDSHPPCKAVYKADMANTNICANVWTHPFSSRWSLTKNCLSAHLLPFQSSMPGELTGGVIFQAFRQYAADHPNDPLDTSGIMPAWAMVPLHPEKGQDDSKGGRHGNHHFLRRHKHHGDFPGVLGIIMPFQKFRGLGTYLAARRTTAQVAALLHTSAQGLAYVHELGLAHQDLLVSDFKNVGVVQLPDGTPSHTILFDWGYTAIDDTAAEDTTCTLGRACDFCMESYFPKPRVGGDHGAKGSRRRTLDCKNLRDMFVRVLGNTDDYEPVGRELQDRLQNQVDCSRSTQELADALALAAQKQTVP